MPQLPSFHTHFQQIIFKLFRFNHVIVMILGQVIAKHLVHTGQLSQRHAQLVKLDQIHPRSERAFIDRFTYLRRGPLVIGYFDL